MHNQEINLDDWTPVEIINAQKRNEIKKEMANGEELSVKDLGKFNPDCSMHQSVAQVQHMS